MSKNPMTTTSKKVAKTQLGKMTSVDTANVLREMINAKKEYEITKEVEGTKRLGIESNLKKQIAILAHKREMISEVFEKEYSLRKETIDRMFDYIDKAYEDGNMETVIKAMDSIEGIVKSCPLKELIQIGKIFESDEELMI